MENGKTAVRIVDATKMTAPEFAVALMGYRDGTILVYHRGDLVRDRKRDKDIHALAKEAYDLYKKGWACLVQRRIRGHDLNFEYCAIARERIDG